MLLLFDLMFFLVLGDCNQKVGREDAGFMDTLKFIYKKNMVLVKHHTIASVTRENMVSDYFFHPSQANSSYWVLILASTFF